MAGPYPEDVHVVRRESHTVDDKRQYDQANTSAHLSETHRGVKDGKSGSK